MSDLTKSLKTSIFGDSGGLLDGLADAALDAVVGRLARSDVTVTDYTELKTAVEAVLPGARATIKVTEDIQWPTYAVNTTADPAGGTNMDPCAFGLGREWGGGGKKRGGRGGEVRGKSRLSDSNSSPLTRTRVHDRHDPRRCRRERQDLWCQGPPPAPKGDVQGPRLGQHGHSRARAGTCCSRLGEGACEKRKTLTENHPPRPPLPSLLLLLKPPRPRPRQTRSAFVVEGEYRSATQTTVSTTNPGSTVSKGSLTIKNIILTDFVIQSNPAEFLPTDPNFTNPGTPNASGAPVTGSIIYPGYYGAAILVLVSRGRQGGGRRGSETCLN